MALEPVYAAFGKRIRFIRDAIGMTQEELAHRIGLERTSVNNIEAGKQRVTLHTVQSLAKALNTSPAHLLKESLL